MAHYETHACIEKAAALLRVDDTDSLRYATLQLRMGIEYLFYELVPLYRGELPEGVLDKWQPREILTAILECDPDAANDKRFAFRASGCSEEQEWDTVLETKAPNKALLNDYYHRLGAYLHAPKDMKDPPVEKWKRALERALAALLEYKPEQALSNIGEFVEFNCECGAKVKRRSAAIKLSSRVRCLDPKCGKMYDVELKENEFKAVRSDDNYQCPYCKTTNYVFIDAIRENIPITCCECGKRVVVRKQFVLEPLDAV